MNAKHGTVGLTLLELILAMTILSTILLAVGGLNVSAMRLSAASGEDARLHNEIQYVLRDIEKNIRPFKTPSLTLESCVNNVCTQTLRVIDPNDPENPIDKYTYTKDAQDFITISKINFVDDEETIETLSAGVLIKKTAPDGNGQMPIFAISTDYDDLVEINLAAKKDLNDGRTITLSGISKSILLRGGSS